VKKSDWEKGFASGKPAIVKCCGNCVFYEPTPYRMPYCFNEEVPNHIREFASQWASSCPMHDLKQIGPYVKESSCKKIKGGPASQKELADEIFSDFRNRNNKGPFRKDWVQEDCSKDYHQPPKFSIGDIVYIDDDDYNWKVVGYKYVEGFTDTLYVIDRVKYYGNAVECSRLEKEKNLIAIPRGAKTIREALDIVFNTEPDAPIRELESSICMCSQLSAVFNGQRRDLEEIIKERVKENEKNETNH